jgi:hypothetical protein
VTQNLSLSITPGDHPVVITDHVQGLSSPEPPPNLQISATVCRRTLILSIQFDDSPRPALFPGSPGRASAPAVYFGVFR